MVVPFLSSPHTFREKTSSFGTADTGCAHPPIRKSLMKHFDSQSTSLAIVNGVMLVLTTVVVGLRCMVRFRTSDIYYLSDGLCMAAYAISVAIEGVMFYCKAPATNTFY